MLQTGSRWDIIYILVGIYAFWCCVYLLALHLSTLTGTIRPSGSIKLHAQSEQLPAVDNPLISSHSHAGEPLNGHSAAEPPV